MLVHSVGRECAARVPRGVLTLLLLEHPTALVGATVTGARSLTAFQLLTCASSSVCLCIVCLWCMQQGLGKACGAFLLVGRLSGIGRLAERGLARDRCAITRLIGLDATSSTPLTALATCSALTQHCACMELEPRRADRSFFAHTNRPVLALRAVRAKR